MQVLQNNISGNSRLALKAAEDVTGQSPAANTPTIVPLKNNINIYTIQEKFSEETWFTSQKKENHNIILSYQKTSKIKIKCK